jgi:hypothetical protein
MVAAIIIIIVLTPLLWLLFAPIFLLIDSGKNKYQAGIRGIFQLQIIPHPEDIIRIYFRVFFLRFRFDPFKPSTEKKARKKKKKKKHRRIKIPGFHLFRLFGKMAWKGIKTFRIKKFVLNLDTDNIILNGYLIPTFVIVNNWKKVNLNINYSGDFYLNLLIEGRLINLIISTIVTYIKFKFKY